MTTVTDNGSLSLMEVLQGSESIYWVWVVAPAITITMPTFVQIGPTNYHTLSRQ